MEKGMDEKYAMEDFVRVPKIDAHAHITTDGNAMIEVARASNFRLFNIAVDVVDEYPPMPEQIRVLSKHHREHPDISIFCTSFTLEGWDEPGWSEKVVEKLREDFNHGAVAVKVWKNIGMDERNKEGNLIMLDDPKFDAIFQFIKDQGKVLVSHAGEPKNCWLPLEEMTVNNDKAYFGEHPEFHMYLHPELPSYEQQIEARDNMLEKNPELVFIGCHLASLEWSVDKIAKFLDRFPKSYVDLAARISHIQYQSHRDPEKVRDFFIKYQDRILYGTDSQQLDDADPAGLKTSITEVWLRDWKYFNTTELVSVPELDDPVKGLGLSANVINKIYCQNVEKVFPGAWQENN